MIANKTVWRSKRISTSVFSGVFRHIQLAGLYALYYDIDFSKKRMENFNSKLVENNQKTLDHELDAIEMENYLKYRCGIDTHKEAYGFPFRAKMKMCGHKIKQKDIPLTIANVDDAIDIYLTLAAWTLRKNYRFKPEEIMAWWEKVKEFCMNYAEGMKDEHVLQYFKMECDLDITE